MQGLYMRGIGSLWLWQAWGGRAGIEWGARDLPGAIGLTPFHDVSRSVSDCVKQLRFDQLRDRRPWIPA